MSLLLPSYGLFMQAARPLFPLLLAWRARRGKEDPTRLRERRGHSSITRPKGKLIWIHAASVGEARSVLPLMETVLADLPESHILLTTGTVTSANLVAQARATRALDRLIHQFIPIDHPRFMKRFFDHWRPDLGFVVESELWPHMLTAAKAACAQLTLLNARMSDRSFRNWSRLHGAFDALIGVFDTIAAQDNVTHERLTALGCTALCVLGNLKLDAPALACDAAALKRLRADIGARPVWLAASTHPEEEKMIAETHNTLAAKHTGLLTIIVPRHPERGPDIASQLKKQARVTRRSSDGAVTAKTEIYVADTLGELGLFYRIASAAFIGGSLVAHGGQNPLEAIRLDTAVVVGPFVQNFREIYGGLTDIGGVLRVGELAALAPAIDALLTTPEARAAQIAAGHAYLDKHTGATERYADFFVAQWQALETAQRGA